MSSIKSIQAKKQKAIKQQKEIAVIGIACRVSGASNKEAYWEIIKNGIDCTHEIEADRWGDLSWYDPDTKKAGTSYCKQSGFMPDSDKFDPMFFNLSPKEAETMDPQQRVFLEESWKCLEDAGYAPNSFSGKNIGVFVGVGAGDYLQLLHSNEGSKEGLAFTGNSNAVLAARISYLLNLKGPVIAVDTACSSALVAIDRAIKSIECGESELALAGGVHIYTTPSDQIWASQIRIMSKTGKCRTFDDRADGLIQGEAAGVLLLKPLDKAIEDGDRIYGVIKGSGVNQNGKNKSLTAPSISAQQELEQAVYQKSNINPESIGYVEAHGTGTRKGDPMEVDALIGAFRSFTEKSNYCALGSVKPNIGHTAKAAGVCGIIKVLLMLQHKQLPPLANFEKLNHRITLKDSPFFINTELKAWAAEKDVPRRAAVSSFGFSGSNAHLVLEEYVATKAEYPSNSPAVLVLSAKNRERLREQVANLSAFLENKETINLYDIAYTLQVGRTAMEERLALIANDLPQLREQLQQYQKGKTVGFFIGNVKKDKSDFILTGPAGKDYIKSAIKHKQIDALAQLWVKGVMIDWTLLYEENNKPNKISLPTYPFARERYWVEGVEKENPVSINHQLHPLVHSNISDLKEQKFQSIFTGEELFLAEHQIHSEKILPGVAYLELAREAGRYSLGKTITSIKDITWIRPIIVNVGVQQIQISLFETNDREQAIHYEIYSGQAGEELIHAQGKLTTQPLVTPPPIEIATVKKRLTVQKKGSNCYQIIRTSGVHHGASFQGIETLYYNEEEALSKINLSQDKAYILQPGLLDSAIQTCHSIGLDEEVTQSVRLPFSTRAVNIYGDVHQTTWVYVCKSKHYKTGNRLVSYDIDLLSDTGEVLLRFEEFVSLPLDSNPVSAPVQSPSLQLYTPSWEASPIVSTIENTDNHQVVILAGASASLGERLGEDLEQEVLVIETSDEIAYYLELQNLLQGLDGKQRTNITLVYHNKEAVHYKFISGLLKTAHLENPKITGKTLGVDSLSIKNLVALSEIIQTEQNQPASIVRYQNSIRQVPQFSTLAIGKEQNLDIQPKGIYLITGGAGGLGLIFAEYIAQTANTQLILIGRSKECKLSSNKLQELRANYFSCDITDKKAVKKLILEIEQKYGQLNGIIHSAGLIKDSFLANKTAASAQAVLAPKIQGAKNLDAITKHLSLDFTIYFSSVAGVIGNIGQADYAAANAWLDGFAAYRNSLMEQGKRKGKTISVNWPLWQAGGMQIDDLGIDSLIEKYGFLPLPTPEGVRALEKILQAAISQGTVLYARGSALEKINISNQSLSAKKIIETKSSLPSKGEIKEITETIITIISEFLKLDRTSIEIDVNLSNYGLDSILMMNIIRNIESQFLIDLSPTVLIEHPTIEEFCSYLAEQDIKVVTKSGYPVTKNELYAPLSLRTSERKKLIRPEVTLKPEIAIIAYDAFFYQADTPELLWSNVKKQILGVYEKNQQETYLKLTDFSPNKHAIKGLSIPLAQYEEMSLLQQLVFDKISTTIENAGLSKKVLNSFTTGVFVTASEIEVDREATAAQHLVNMLPTKISYQLDLRGPSELHNAFCVSTYLLIHKAIQSIHSGDCEQALIVAVNKLSEGIEDYGKMEDMNALVSKKGCTLSFSDNSDGYVRSEGIGVLLLQKKSIAERENNKIYGLIKGSSFVHGGKSISWSAPNPKGIKTAIELSLSKSNITADSIDYIEAHGIANPIADAIELTAIEAAYKKLSKDPAKKWHIGSIKPTIGHSELASGMASLIKVLKAFEHQTIPGIAGLETINTEIPSNHSLLLTKENTPWKKGEHPRRAALNSYAVGGVNAHVILEEYVDDNEEDQPNQPSQSIPKKVEHTQKAPNLSSSSHQEKILAIAKTTFQVELDLNRSPIDYDFDSVKIIRFVRRINEQFGITVKLGQVLSVETFKEIFDLFETAIQQEELPKTTAVINTPSLSTRYPLSEGQKGLWAIQATSPDSTIYNVPIALCLEEMVPTGLIYEAAQQLMANHPILKVVFNLAEDGELYQIIVDEKILREDVAIVGEAVSIPTVFNELLHQPFDLAKEVLRLHIRRAVETQKIYVLFVIHHIAIDGTSVTLLAKNFLTILQHLQAGKPLSIGSDNNYFEFINWEQTYIKSEQGQGDVAYWQKKLSGSLEKIALPYDSLPPDGILDEGNRELPKEGKASFSIEGTALNNLKAVAKAQKVTLSLYLLAIFKVLLYRLSHTEDIIIIQPTAGRPAEKYNKSIGYYINIMLSRTSLSADQSFAEVVQDLKKELIESIDHVQYPYPKLLAELDLTRAERDGLFPVSFNYLNIFDELLHENQSTSGLMEDIEQALTDEYGLEVMDLRTKLIIQFKYQNNLFSSATIERHLGYFRRILAATKADSKTKIGEIALLGAVEKNQLLVAFNDTKVDFPQEKTIIDLFEEQVEKTPDNIAVIFEDKQLTYKELNERANRVGHYLLKTYNIQPDDIIALQLERSEWMIIAILGVMKAGAAYLPIATDSPKARTEFMLQDSQAKVLLTDEATKELAKELERTLPIEIIEQIKSRKRTNPQLATRNSHDLAYIIYTSGSTGQPKGVMIEHIGVTNFIQKPIELFGVNSADKILQFSTYTFDTSIAEIFLGLFTGAAVVIPVTTQLSIDEFINLVRTHQITILDLPPKFLTALNRTTFESVRILQLGGEAVDINTIKHYSKLYRCFNVYGPTEATVATTLFEVRADWKLPSIPIGTPLHNTQIYILNSQNVVMPIGVKGELCIAGAGLARGYLNNAELTAQKFILHPFKEGERLYKTGDLARWLPDGNIEFLGRVDHQLKVRGYRIEAGEIEQALLEYNAIQSVVVIGYNKGGQATELVAYMVPTPNAVIPSIETLRNDLAQSLPAYMIPAYFVELDSLPLTSSGKVDRKALPSLDMDSLVASATYEAPRNAVEQTLVDIWEALLNRKSIGIHDNFFAIGGHSLRAIRLIALIQVQLAAKIKLSEVFAQPTIAALAPIVQQQAQLHPALLVSIPSIEQQDDYALSNAQRRLWVLDQMEEHQIAYNMPMAIQLDGRLGVAALEKAFQLLFDRHESLRTNFAEGKQVIRRTDFKLNIQDFTKADQQSIQAAIRNHAHFAFDLEKDNLLQLALLKTADREHILLFNMHHIISDGWSMAVLNQELSALYTTLMDGNKTPFSVLSPLPIQYKEYAAWQNEILASEQIIPIRQFWRDTLAADGTGQLPLLELPTDYPRPAIKTYNGDSINHIFNPATLQALKVLTQNQGATLFMTLAALVNILLHRYTGQQDILLGTPSAGRNHPDLNDQIGFYINTLVLRNQIQPAASFSTFLEQVKIGALAAFENELYPFDQLVEELNIPRDTSRSAVFDVMLVLENNEQADLSLGGLVLNMIESPSTISKFDLTFIFMERKEGLAFNLEYNTDLFEKQTIQRFISHLDTLIQSVLQAPQATIGSFNILPNEERELFLHTFNDTKADFPADKTIIDLFEEQVEKTPNSIAVVFEETQLTYRQLNEQANRVGHYLRKTYQIQPDDIIALQLERSDWMIISILGVMKAGAAYLPIAPDAPKARTAFILQDAKAKVLLTDKATYATASEHQPIVAVEVIEQIKSRWNIPKQPGKKTNLDSITTSKDLAYIIYTSGSTGQPKGVMIEHQGIVNRLNWMQKAYPINEQDCILQKTPYTFDVSVWELLWWALQGAKVAILEPGAEKEPAKIIDAIDKYQVSTMHFVPSMLNAFLGHIQEFPIQETTKSLRQVFASGEALGITQVHRFFKYIGKEQTTLHNLYGPTEASIDVSYFDCRGLGNRITVPIGQPIDNMELHIINSQQELAPIGISGELCISGIGLARGYLNNKELTDKKFILHPFKEGERLYRTGDLARWLPDGNIEFLGRIDHQLKIRGYRIEAGEIEQALLAHAAIQSVVVIGYDTADTKELVAYLVPIAIGKETVEMPDIATLRSFLSESLPDYMIPAYFVELDKLPLTSSGKVNRKALPSPDVDSIASGTVYEAPRNRVEQTLVDLWKTILRKEVISIHDNFFHLGGDSIKAIQVTARLAAHDLSLSIRDLFSQPTIAGLASLVQQKRRQYDQGLQQGSLPLTAIQHWAFKDFLVDKYYFNQAIRLSAKTPLSIPLIKASLQQLLAQHDMLRTVFEQQGTAWTQHTKKEGLLDLQITDLRWVEQAEKQIEQLANETHASFDLMAGSLFKARLIHTRDSDELLLFIHHLVVDGISWRILIEDLETAYAQLSSHQKIQLPAKTAPFALWAQEIQAYATTPALLKEVDFWNGQLSNINLPIANPTIPNLVEHCTSIGFELTNQQTKALLTKANWAYNTEINDILLTALSRALTTTFEQQAYGITLEGHGREDLLDLDISRTIGWFTSMYPVLLTYEENLGIHLQSTKETLHRIPNKGIGYGILNYLSKTSLAKDTSQILFNYLGEFTTDASKGIFTFSESTTGLGVNPKAIRQQELNVSGILIEGKLSMSIIYNPHRMDTALIGQLRDTYQAALVRLTNHCVSQTVSLPSPADFTACDLNLSQYQQFLDREDLQATHIADIYPLSPLQEGMLFHRMMNPDDAAYFNQLDISLDSGLDTFALKQAWLQLVQRHTMFRTSFYTEGLDRPLQVVKKEVALNWYEEDISQLTPQQQEKRISLYLENDRAAGFDLREDSLLRFALFKQTEGYRLIKSTHHIISDGWSLAIVFKELMEAYQGKPLIGQKEYAPFIAWLESKDKQSQEAFWKNYLVDYETASIIPFLKVPDPSIKGNTKEYNLKFSDNQTKSLNQLAAKAGVSLNTVIQGIWSILLARYNGQFGNPDVIGEVVFGMTTSGRSAPISDIENQTGLFINTIPVRIRLDPSYDFIQFLQNIHGEAIALKEQEHYSLASIQGLWEGIGDLFDHIMVFENYPMDENLQKNEKTLGVTQVVAYEQIHYGFGITILPGKELTIKLSYHTAQIATEAVERIGAHLDTLIQRVLKEPQAVISSLNILPSQERELLLHTFNDTKADFPTDKTIIDLFEEQVQKKPNAIALSFEDKQWTYAQLNQAANQLAHFILDNYPIQNNPVIALLPNRSEWMPIGILAILKTGAAYLPLAHDLPSDRLSFMLKDSEASLLLTDRHQEQLAQQIFGEVCLLETAISKKTTNPNITIVPDNLAFVLYTSGSTGQPKGVLMPHQPLVNLLYWHIHNSACGLGTKTTQFAAFSFDASFHEIFATWLSAGELVMIGEQTRKDLFRFADLIVNQQIERIFLPFAALQELAQILANHPGDISALKVIQTAGEQLQISSAIIQLFERIPVCELKNHYGPTEAHVVSEYVLSGNPNNWTALPPIGEPIANTQLYILDEQLRPVPIGVKGALYIGGVCLAKGYLNLPQLTDERFISNPFKEGERLYKTGDLAHYLPDGNIVFLGRADHQLKIRGYRVELGEIEQALLSHPAISAGVVLGKEIAGINELIAYLILKEEKELAIEKLRSFLGESLPDYMIPSYFIPMEMFPLTSSGKVNRKVLPSPDVDSLNFGINYEAPRNEVEQKLVDIWEELLDRKPIGIHNNFFATGGHSLRAIRLITLIQSRLAVKIKLTEVFAQPTIAELAKLIQGEQDIRLFKDILLSNKQLEVSNKNKIEYL